MDTNGEPIRWSPPVGLIGLGWALTAAAVAWLLFSETAPDRLFIGVLVLALAAVSAHGSIYRPRLLADATGVTVRGIGGTRQWRWSQVSVRIRDQRRFGRTTRFLELDADEHLVILTKLDLGADPEDVAAELHRLRH